MPATAILATNQRPHFRRRLPKTRVRHVVRRGRGSYGPSHVAASPGSASGRDRGGGLHLKSMKTKRVSRSARAFLRRFPPRAVCLAFNARAAPKASPPHRSPRTSGCDRGPACARAASCRDHGAVCPLSRATALEPRRRNRGTTRRTRGKLRARRLDWPVTSLRGFGSPEMSDLRSSRARRIAALLPRAMCRRRSVPDIHMDTLPMEHGDGERTSETSETTPPRRLKCQSRGSTCTETLFGETPHTSVGVTGEDDTAQRAVRESSSCFCLASFALVSSFVRREDSELDVRKRWSESTTRCPRKPVGRAESRRTHKRK